VLLGLGASAIGRMPQGYVQNQAGIRAYEASIGSGRLATVRGLALDTDDRMRATVIERLMCDFEVDLGSFAQHGFERELAALAPLVRDGLVTIDCRRLQVTPAGRPFLRSVAAVFDRYLRPECSRHSQGV
jgi:oxygen-independent coproporphyrinogen-3 oxidase